MASRKDYELHATFRWSSVAASVTMAIALSVAQPIRPPTAWAADPAASTLPAAASDVERAALIETRLSLGLSTDLETIENLTQRHLEFTTSEGSTLDLKGRMAYEILVEEEVVPFVTNLSSFGGIWFDQADGGRAVVLLTERSEDLEAQIAALLPSGALPLRFSGARVPYRSLKAAARPAWDAWKAAPGLPALLGVGLDTRGNRLVMRVPEEAYSAAVSSSAQLSSSIGVPFAVEASTEDHDTTCQDRDHCEDPLMPGIRLAKGDTTVDDCTMGFHVYANWPDDPQWVTAGHCGYTGLNSWYHQGYHGANGRLVGSETGTLLGQDGFDIMRVSMVDNQETALVYNDSIRTYGWVDDDAIAQGSVVKASRGHTDVVSTGTVQSTWTSWTSDKGGFVRVWGLDTTLASAPGDSGSPVYQEGTYRVAVGVLNNENGNVTMLDNCWEEWGGACSPYAGGPYTYNAIVAGDFTGDGSADLIAEHPSGNVYLYPHTPAGFGVRSLIASGWQNYPVLAAADFNGDSYPDVIAKGADGNLYLYPHTPSGFGARSTIGTGWSTFPVILAADFTGDGSADLIAQHVSGLLKLYPHTPAGFGTPSTIGTGWETLPVLAAGDFTNDGSPDIVARHTSGVLKLYPHTPSGWGTPTNTATGWDDYTILIGPDFTGDGHQDILGRDVNQDLYLAPWSPFGFGALSEIGTGF